MKKKIKQMLTRIIVTAGLMAGCLAPGYAMAATTPATPLTLVDGWNLKGTSIAIDVDKTFSAKTTDGLATKYTSVWTWNPAVGNWRVFLADGSMASYASDKGFGQLVAIAPGDGFWVNVNAGQGGELTATPYQNIVEYLPGTGMKAPKQGKTQFQIKITKASDNTPATGLAPSLTFTMHMENGMNHSTPADLVSESDTTPGLYNCTAYYSMASGAGMGTWDMVVNVGEETTTFHPDVAMAMGSTTFRAKLKGVTDMIMGTAAEKRDYYLFHDGLTSAMGKYTFNLFIATKESMFNMPTIGTGSTLMDELTAAWTVNSMTVEASTDKETWLSATEGDTGHWSIANLTGLTSGQEGKIYVRMSVNGEFKTTDGADLVALPDGTNGYATFTVTPPSGM